MEMIDYEAERMAHFESNQLHGLEQAKSEIFIMCQKIQNDGSEKDQISGIHELNQFLVKRERNEK